MPTAFLALGSNLGNRQANMRMSIGAMTRMARILDASSLYETVPEPPGQPSFYNAAVAIETGLDPIPLLRFLHMIEEEIGRRPGAERNGPRPIDIDILLYDDITLEDSRLTIPHPRMTERAFVLTPLAEIAAEVMVRGKTVGELAKAAGDASVQRVAERGWDGIAGRPQGRVRI